MKQFLFLICIALSVCSCNAVKKITSHKHTTQDSTGTKASSFVEVKKTDSTTKETTQESGKKQAESGYKKTTTRVEEYFSDEFGEDTTISKPGDTAQAKINPGPRKPANIPGNLKRRTTTVIEEEGFRNEIEAIEKLHEKAGQLRGSDSLSADQKETASQSSTQDEKQSSKVSFSLLPWWLWLLVILAIAGVLWYKSRF